MHSPMWFTLEIEWSIEQGLKCHDPMSNIILVTFSLKNFRLPIHFTISVVSLLMFLIYYEYKSDHNGQSSNQI